MKRGRSRILTNITPSRKDLIIVLVLIAISFAIFYTKFYFFPTEQVCTDRECFDQAMVQCKRGISFIDEQEKATWQYKIIWKGQSLCTLELTLLLAKSGPLGLSSIEGRSMQCTYQLGAIESPGADLNKCQGYLKEGLQELIIKKLYQYVVGNLDQIRAELNPVST